MSTTAEDRGVPALSPRERDVCELLLLGKSNKEIAAGLGIRIRTAKFHLSNICRRLGVGSRTEAVLRLAASRPTQSPALLPRRVFRRTRLP